jgi:hypothetical protein
VPKRVTYSQEIEATPDKIWGILADPTRLPDWAYTEGRFPYPVEGKYGSEQTEGVGTIWIGIAADGQVATQKITAWETASQLTYELQETENAPLQMAQTNSFSLEPVSLLVRFTANGAFEEMMTGSLDNLKTLVEEEAVGSNGTSTTPDEDGKPQTKSETQPA